MRAVKYTRISDEEKQGGGFSLTTQDEAIEGYCRMKGWTIVRAYEDKSTGRDVDRPGFQSMMNDINRWDIVVVYRLDRITRSLPDFYKLTKELTDRGKQYASVQEGFDTSTAMGRAVIDIMVRIAQLESDQISERTVANMKTAKSKGVHTGRPPAGYIKKGSRFIWSGEASNIISLYSSGSSVLFIARQLGRSWNYIDRIIRAYRKYGGEPLKASQRSL